MIPLNRSKRNFLQNHKSQHFHLPSAKFPPPFHPSSPTPLAPPPFFTPIHRYRMYRPRNTWSFSRPLRPPLLRSRPDALVADTFWSIPVPEATRCCRRGLRTASITICPWPCHNTRESKMAVRRERNEGLKQREATVGGPGGRRDGFSCYIVRFGMIDSSFCGRGDRYSF